MPTLTRIRRIAEEVRREQPGESVGSCQFVAGVLAERLVSAGLAAIRVGGYYVESKARLAGTASEASLPDATNTRWDGVWMHWWVECEGFVIDVTADQVGWLSRRAGSIRIVPKPEALAYCERLPRSLAPGGGTGQFEQ